MRLFLQPHLWRARFFHGLALAGAGAVGAVVLSMASTPLLHVAQWIGAVLLSELCTTAVNERLARVAPSPDRLPFWATVKTGTSGLQGLSWALGVYFLHVPGEPVTVLAPAWAIITVTVGIIYACAAWPPALHGMAAAANLPAAIILLIMGGTVETAVAVCMAVSLVFALMIGTLAIRNVGDLIRARIDVAELLDRQTALTERLAALNADRTRFFSAASHDLRQPLQALGFYTTLLAEMPLRSARARELVPRLAACVEALDRQFNAILGVAATDGTVARARLAPVAVDDILARVAESQRPDAQLKGLALRLRASGLVAMAAPEVLERMVQNLLSNALRYTRKGGVLLSARRRGPLVEILVADTGIGIAEADHGRIFDDYVQLANPERNALAGFGLGLAIVKRLCDGMGWRIAVRSTPGRGSVFTLSLASAPPNTLAKRIPEVASLPDLPPVSVVILDDDGKVRDATSRLLHSWGLRYLTLADSSDLEARITAFRASDGTSDGRLCVILDQRLAGGETGISVADRLRAALGSDIGLIMLTGETAPELSDAARERGMILLAKPIKPIRLRAAFAALATPADVRT